MKPQVEQLEDRYVMSTAAPVQPVIVPIAPETGSIIGMGEAVVTPTHYAQVAQALEQVWTADHWPELIPGCVDVFVAAWAADGMNWENMTLSRFFLPDVQAVGLSMAADGDVTVTVGEWWITLDDGVWGQWQLGATQASIDPALAWQPQQVIAVQPEAGQLAEPANPGWQGLGAVPPEVAKFWSQSWSAT